jgi:hypothetical protein
MRLISRLEPTEQESPGIGIWQNIRGGQHEFGYVSYREGNAWLCVEFATNVEPGDCTLVVTGTFDVDNDDLLTGEVLITVKQRSDGLGDYTLGPYGIEARRKSIEDLKSTHVQP